MFLTLHELHRCDRRLGLESEVRYHVDSLGCALDTELLRVKTKLICLDHSGPDLIGPHISIQWVGTRAKPRAKTIGQDINACT